MKNKVIYCCFLLFISFQIYAQTGVLSYADFLRNIQENHPASLQGENVKKLGQNGLRSAQGKFDPQLSGDYENKYFKGIDYYSYATAEVKQQIYSSQYIKAGYEYGNGLFLSSERITSSYGLPYLGIEVGVLQGMVIDKNRADVLKARSYVEYYNAERNNILNKLYLEASNSYFDWIFYLKKQSLNLFFMSLADQRLKGIEALANIGERAGMDTIEAAVFYQTRLLDYQSSLIDIQKSVTDLSTFNYTSEQPTELLTQSIPDDSLETYYEKAKMNVAKIIAEDIDNPVANKYRYMQKVLDVEVRLRSELIKPKLNLSYNFLSSDAALFSNTLSTNNYKWGVNFAVPLYLRTARNDYKSAKLNSRNNELELINVRNELYFKSKATIAAIQLLTDQINNADRSVRYNRNLVEAEKLKFLNGESSLFLVNARENKWLESELKAAEYKLKYIQQYFYLVYLKGSLNYVL